jgi:hypothetical protein
MPKELGGATPLCLSPALRLSVVVLSSARVAMTTTTTGPGDNPNRPAKTWVGRVKMKAVGDRLALETCDATEAFIRGSIGLGFLLRHPKVAFFMASGGLLTLLLSISVVWGAIYIVFARPGSVQFAWDRPTTYIPAVADIVRRPVGSALADLGDRLSGEPQTAADDEAGNYDPNAYDE